MQQWLKKQRPVQFLLQRLESSQSNIIDSKDASWPQLTFIILVLIAVSSLPVVVYVMDGPDLEDRNTDASRQWVCGQEWECNPIEHSLISSSVCSRYLSWLQRGNAFANSSAETVSIFASGEGCSLARKEKDLALLIQLTALASTKCQSHAVSLVCNYYYRPCTDYTYWLTRDECQAVKEDYCSLEWKFLEQRLKAGDYCLGIPNCDSLPPLRQKMINGIQMRVVSNSLSDTTLTVTCSISSSIEINRTPEGPFNTTSDNLMAHITTPVFTKSSVAVRKLSFDHTSSLPERTLPSPSPVLQSQPTGNNSNSNRSVSSCKSPFLSSTTNHGTCSPPCPADAWLMPKEGFTALRAILAVCSALGCTCSFVIFYTWARIKSLRVFPHVVTLFMTMFYFIAGLY